MSDTETLTSGARTRIRTFTFVVSGLVVAAIAIGALASGAFSIVTGGDVIVTDDDYYRPWENPRPVAADRDGDGYSGAGQAYIALTGLTPGEPFLVDYDDDGPIRGVYMTGPDGAAPRGLDTPSDFTTYGTDLYVVPSQSDIELWVRTYERDPWTLAIRPAGLEERSGTISGVGPGAFLYTGGASAARVTTRGEYSVSIDVVTVRGPETVYSSAEAPSASIAWPDSATTVFVVDSYSEESSWSIEFFEQAGSPGTPAPAPEPTAGSEADDE